MAKGSGKGKVPKKRGPAKTRNVVPADSDRATGDDLDRAGGVVDRRSKPVDRAANEQQRLFAEYLVQDPDRCAMTAAWKAGYCGGNPDDPVPEDRRKRLTLAQTGSRLQGLPWVAAVIADLDARATAAFLATPVGSEVLEHIEARERAAVDIEKLAAANREVIAAIALHDPRKVIKWGPGWVEVTSSDDLAYEDAILVKEVKHVETFGEGGPTTTTTVRFADRAPYVKMLGQIGGMFSQPVRHEISGPGGGPIEAAVSVAQAPDSELLEECGRELLGVAPGSVSGAEPGLSPEEVIAILKGWSDDPEPHVSVVHELFSEAALEESRARYLDDVD